MNVITVCSPRTPADRSALQRNVEELSILSKILSPGTSHRMAFGHCADDDQRRREAIPYRGRASAAKPTNAPQFTGVSRATNGAVDLSVTGDAGLLYLFKASTNLANWTKVGVRTNLTGTIQFTDTKATNYVSRFYRVSVP